MDDYNNQSGTGSTGTAARMKEQIAEKAADVKEKVTEFGRKAADKIDDSRQSAAGALDKTATSLHSGSDKLSGVAHSAADKIKATSDYVRRTDLKGMAADVCPIGQVIAGRSSVCYGAAEHF